jgi:hypothetical protein
VVEVVEFIGDKKVKVELQYQIFDEGNAVRVALKQSHQ